MNLPKITQALNRAKTETYLFLVWIFVSVIVGFQEGCGGARQSYIEWQMAREQFREWGWRKP